MLRVSFILKQAQTAPGQHVFVVGNQPELGGWKVRLLQLLLMC